MKKRKIHGLLRDHKEERERLKQSFLSKLFPSLLVAYLAMMVFSFGLAYRNVSENNLFLVLLNFAGLFFFFTPLIGLYNAKGGLLSLTFFAILDDWYRHNSLTFFLLLIAMFSPSCIYTVNIGLDFAQPTTYSCTVRQLSKTVNKSTSYHFYFLCPDLQPLPFRLLVTGKNLTAEKFFLAVKKGDAIQIAIKPGALGIQHILGYRPTESPSAIE